MTGTEDTYSRLVFWLKIVMPLAALAVLSTLFMFSRRIDPSDAIPYANVDVDTLAREQRLTEPNYSGVTQDGSALAVSAEMARPDPDVPGRASATGLVARIDTPDGGRTDVSAPEGTIDTASQTLTLTGGTEIRSSTGYTLHSPSINAALDSTHVVAQGGVVADGPIGRLTADTMVLERESEPEAGYLLVFKGAVKLVYEPQD